MAEMDVLQSKIIQQIEAYLTDDNLKNDFYLAKYECENDGWIPVERLNSFFKLSTYKYDTILNALYSKRSNIIELNCSDPICIRRRRQPLMQLSIEQNPDINRTVVVSGLPRDAKHEELIEFFNRFYPVYKIRMLSSLRTSNSFNGKVHVIFEKNSDALEFVHKSELVSIIYVNDYVLQLCNGYTLVCRMLMDCDDKDENDLIKQKDQLRFRNGQTFSHRLSNNRPRVSFNTNVSLSNDSQARPKPQSIPYQTKSCLKSSTCATEQILFCQNTTDNKLSKVLDYKNQSAIFNCYSYEFYIPNHLLKQSHECVIIAALNPHCFTVQLKQDAIEFDKFQREINDFYNKIDDKQYLLVPKQIHANLCVMCADPKSSDNDKIWNRSQILDFDSTDNTVNLFYVDLGTWDEYVPINRLRLLIDCFHRHLVFSLTCRLAHISPLNTDGDDLTWSNDATHQFLAVIDQVTPEIEFISFGQDGCFQTNLFVTNSGQYVCVNDYMIHIKKATAIVQPTNIDDNNQTIVQFDKNCSININPPIHPVIALYNQLGEALKRSLIISRSASLNNSLMSSSDISSKSLVKVIHIHIKTHSINQQLNSEQKLPIIFIYYQNNILIPDFNICTLLKIINSNIDIDTIQDYASAIKYHSLQITRELNSDVFIQIDYFVYVRALNIVSLYSIDFVHSILEYFHFTIGNVYLELEHAKYVQLNALDLVLWFKMNNELASSSSDNSMKKLENEQKPTVKRRLPFSNRLISST
ncbi:unnamed protein product [Rotaria magnacalcarata]|uniref:Uncharacterized protein n=4 Tax=Rotaria magnacalcarata TaxID=392030 RepID=A0A816U9F0_9BILA|nr:unnamed protein product [Rotaria magnacalcarata]CAF2148581.1 unnamed protein product [Rotaria magnacalcarata]